MYKIKSVLCVGFVLSLGFCVALPSSAQSSDGWAYTWSYHDPNGIPSYTGNGAFASVSPSVNWGGLGNIASGTVDALSLVNARLGYSGSASAGVYNEGVVSASWRNLSTGGPATSPPGSGLVFTTSVTWYAVCDAAASYNSDQAGNWLSNRGSASASVGFGGYAASFLPTDSSVGLNGMAVSSPIPQTDGFATITNSLGNPANSAARCRGAVHFGGWASNFDVAGGQFTEVFTYSQSYLVANHLLGGQSPDVYMDFNTAAQSTDGSGAVAFAYDWTSTTG